MKTLVLLVFMLLQGGLLQGCGYVDKFTARQEYKRSLDAYRQCLIMAPTPDHCQRERALVAMNKQAFGTMAAGVTSGGMGYYQFDGDD